MKQTACKWLFTLLCPLFSGCGTVVSLLEQDYSVYSGVRRDLAVIHNDSIFSLVAIVDLPLSFIFDTLLLPLTLTH